MLGSRVGACEYRVCILLSSMKRIAIKNWTQSHFTSILTPREWRSRKTSASSGLSRKA
ncbi:hypothetical protein ACVIDN_005265 [Rhizobium brockwellii]